MKTNDYFVQKNLNINIFFPKLMNGNFLKFFHWYKDFHKLIKNFIKDDSEIKGEYFLLFLINEKREEFYN